MNQTPLEVGAALIYKDGRYLITQRKPEDSFGGFWELPGGKKEPTESLRECIVREIKEELDIEVEVLKFYKIVNYRYPARTVRLNIFLCRHVGGEPKKIEVADFAWALPNELFKFNFPDADQTLIRELSEKNWEEENKNPYAHEYLEGIRLFNKGEYFECHEMVEDIWMRSEGMDHLHYQGIIQLAIALNHYQKGNFAGAMGLYEKACDKWNRLPAHYMGVDLKELREKADNFFEKVREAGAPGMGQVDLSLVPKIPLPV